MIEAPSRAGQVDRSADRPRDLDRVMMKIAVGRRPPVTSDFTSLRDRTEPGRFRERLTLTMCLSIDDHSLNEACRAGKTEAYGTLVRRYQDRLYPTVLRMT